MNLTHKVTNDPRVDEALHHVLNNVYHQFYSHCYSSLHWILLTSWLMWSEHILNL